MSVLRRRLQARGHESHGSHRGDPSSRSTHGCPPLSCDGGDYVADEESRYIHRNIRIRRLKRNARHERDRNGQDIIDKRIVKRCRVRQGSCAEEAFRPRELFQPIAGESWNFGDKLSSQDAHIAHVSSIGDPTVITIASNETSYKARARRPSGARFPGDRYSGSLAALSRDRKRSAQV